MKNLTSLSDNELLNSTRSLVAREREATTALLWHLREIEARRLYADQGYPSIWEYMTRGLGYCEGSAGRRIAAMRLLNEVPNIEPDLKSGALSISNASALQRFFRSEEKQSGRTYSQAEKATLAAGVTNRSRRDCDVLLAGLSPELARQEKIRPVSVNEVEIRFNASCELMAKLEKVKGLLSHRNRSPSFAELFEALADLAIKKLDPDAKRTRPICRPELPIETTSPAKVNRNIPSSQRSVVWRRDKGRCTFVSKENRIRCESRHRLEIHHIHEFARGWQHILENMTLRCKTHNLHAAIETFGPEVMSQYLRLPA